MKTEIILALVGGGALVTGIFNVILFVLQRRAAKEDKTDDYKERIEALEKAQSEMMEELMILTYGIRACLSGLKEQGCNGPVTEAFSMLDKHLNKKAHGG